MDLGFWTGLWHGLRSPIVFLIDIFREPNIGIYSIKNIGAWYDFGFLIALLCIWGGVFSIPGTIKKKSKKEKEWDEIEEKAEEKIMRKIKDWVDKPDTDDPEWEEIGKKVEEKIKKKLKKWVEEDD